MLHIKQISEFELGYILFSNVVSHSISDISNTARNRGKIIDFRFNNTNNNIMMKNVYPVQHGQKHVHL